MLPRTRSRTAVRTRLWLYDIADHEQSEIITNEADSNITPMKTQVEMVIQKASLRSNRDNHQIYEHPEKNYQESVMDGEEDVSHRTPSADFNEYHFTIGWMD